MIQHNFRGRKKIEEAKKIRDQKKMERDKKKQGQAATGLAESQQQKSLKKSTDNQAYGGQEI